MAIRAIIECDLRRPKCITNGARAEQPQGFGMSIVSAHDKAQKAASDAGWWRNEGSVYCPYCSPYAKNLAKNGKL